jgi:hypothetical protein
MLRPEREIPEATLETELHLTNDSEWPCPSCGDYEGGFGILGDATIPTENAIPGAMPVAKGLALLATMSRGLMATRLIVLRENPGETLRPCSLESGRSSRVLSS